MRVKLQKPFQLIPLQQYCTHIARIWQGGAQRALFGRGGSTGHIWRGGAERAHGPHPSVHAPAPPTPHTPHPHMRWRAQFLPQERVVEFASMGPKELLLKTEEAVGRGELLAQHQELSRLRREQKQQEQVGGAAAAVPGARAHTHTHPLPSPAAGCVLGVGGRLAAQAAVEVASFSAYAHVTRTHQEGLAADLCAF